MLAIASGLGGGYLDLFVMLFKKLYWEDEWILRHGRDFPWTVPVSHALVLLFPGVLIASANRLQAAILLLTRRLVAIRDTRDLGGITQAAAVWRLHALSCRRAGSIGQRRGRGPGVVAAGGPIRLGGLLGLLALLAALSSGRQVIQENRAVAGLPSPPTAARNVVLVVWDTVRATT